MSQVEMTDREKEMVYIALKEVEANRDKAFEESISSFGSKSEVHRRFAPGSFGSHEAADRTFIMTENWDSYVLSHPTIAMNPEAYRMAKIAFEFMHEVYQIIACADPEKEQ